MRLVPGLASISLRSTNFLVSALLFFSDNFHYLTGSSRMVKFSRFISFRLLFTVLISDCPDVVFSLVLSLFTWVLFWNVLFGCDWFFSRSVSFRFRFRFFSVSVVLVSDRLSNTQPFFTFSSASSVKMLITHCSSYLSSIAAPPTEFLLRKLVNFPIPKLLRAILVHRWSSSFRCRSSIYYRMRSVLYLHYLAFAKV